MKRLFLASLLLLLAAPAQAVQQNSFIYAKTSIRIVPKPAEQVLEPAQQTDQKKQSDVVITTNADLLPKLKRVPKEFIVEVRDRSFLEQTDFISHQPFADKEGMLILVDPPAEAEVHATRMIASADVFFVNEDGVIIKIAPELKLSTLTESIDSGKPIKAFIYLKAGTAAASDIVPGDRVENSYFKTHPVVIQ